VRVRKRYTPSNGIARRRSNVISNVRVKCNVGVIENACLVARAVRLMTNDKFRAGYKLIKNMQADDFLTALRILAEQEVLIKNACEFMDRQKGKGIVSITALLTRAAEGGDEKAISLLAKLKDPDEAIQC
jgi:hypothetical protein